MYGGTKREDFCTGLTCVRRQSIVGNIMGISKPPKNGKASRIDPGRRAARSLRKRGCIWWTHFGCKGQFFRRSLGTSDRSKATREAETLIALAEAGKIQATASSIEERKAQKSASLKKSDADPKLNRALCRRNQKGWDGRDSESRERHSEAIKAAASRPGAGKVRSERSTSLWLDKDYRDRNTAAVNKGWKSRKLRKQQSERIKAARARPEVKAHHLAGRYRAAETLLKQRGAASDGAAAPRRGRGRPRMDEWYGSAAILHRQGASYRECARQKDPEFAKDPDAATEKMRIGIRRWERSQKQETPR